MRKNNSKNILLTLSGEKVSKTHCLQITLYGPKTADHPSIGEHCPICEKPFEEGDYTTLMPITPSDKQEEKEMREGRSFIAVSKEIHSFCPNTKNPQSSKMFLRGKTNES